LNTSEYNKSVDLYTDSIYRFVLKNLKDTEKSKDIVQDVYEKVWAKRDSVDFEKIKSYLFTAAYRTMIDYIRKESKSADFETVNQESFSYEEDNSDLNEQLQKALDQLPEVQKSVIMLRDYEGYSYDEISEITKLSTSQVKVYIYRARKFLQKYLVSIETLI
jgi:RNA polymerase sigma-70 factor (ECF subfamily)